MYIAKAFIQVRNKKRRDFIKQELGKLFKRSTNSKFERAPYFLFANGSYEQNNKYCMFLHSKIEAGFINCNFYANGDEEKAIELFLELAKMRNNPLRDWNVNNKGELFNPLKTWVSGKSRLATPLEFAEAFKQGKVNLK